MSEQEIDNRLARIGDRLEAAVAIAIGGRNTSALVGHDIDVPTLQEVSMSPNRPPSSRARRRVAIASGLVGLVLAGTGVAAAVGGLSTDEIERGMPGGTWIFSRTNPTCTTTDDVVYDCTLTNPPRPERTDITYRRIDRQSDGSWLISPEASPRVIPGEYRGRRELITDDESRIAGGCIGQDDAGMRWTCFVGERAVDEGILSADLLGQPSGPGLG
jgi:hypothetical protein